MHAAILWIGFLSAWLLFSGSIYQAALELQEEDIEIDRIREAGRKVAKPTRTSIWWWLLPPVKIYLEHTRQRDYQRRYLEMLTAEDVEALVSFRNKAAAWQIVALGGLLFGIKETYELVEYMEWNNVVFALMLVGMALLGILNLITRVLRSRAITALKD